LAYSKNLYKIFSNRACLYDVQFPIDIYTLYPTGISYYLNPEYVITIKNRLRRITLASTRVSLLRAARCTYIDRHQPRHTFSRPLRGCFDAQHSAFEGAATPTHYLHHIVPGSAYAQFGPEQASRLAAYTKQDRKGQGRKGQCRKKKTEAEFT
jgi:hypothetical protein